MTKNELWIFNLQKEIAKLKMYAYQFDGHPRLTQKEKEKAFEERFLVIEEQLRYFERLLKEIRNNK